MTTPTEQIRAALKPEMPKEFKNVLIGGNHLASALIGIADPAQYRRSDYYTVLGKHGQPYADMWVAWKAIMNFRDHLENTRADLAPPSDKDREEAAKRLRDYCVEFRQMRTLDHECPHKVITKRGQFPLLTKDIETLVSAPTTHAAELEKVRTLIEKAGIDMTDGDKAEALSILTAIIEKKGA